MDQKAIYEVRVEVDNEVADSYLEWLQRHMKQIVELAGFERAEMYTENGQSPNVKVWVVHYVAPSMKTVDDYLSIHSKKFRADGIERFGGRFRIERRVLAKVPDLTAPSVD